MFVSFLPSAKNEQPSRAAHSTLHRHVHKHVQPVPARRRSGDPRLRTSERLFRVHVLRVWTTEVCRDTLGRRLSRLLPLVLLPGGRVLESPPKVESPLTNCGSEGRPRRRRLYRHALPYVLGVRHVHLARGAEDFVAREPEAELPLRVEPGDEHPTGGVKEYRVRPANRDVDNSRTGLDCGGWLVQLPWVQVAVCRAITRNRRSGHHLGLGVNVLVLKRDSLGCMFTLAVPHAKCTARALAAHPHRPGVRHQGGDVAARRDVRHSEGADADHEVGCTLHRGAAPQLSLAAPTAAVHMPSRAEQYTVLRTGCNRDDGREPLRHNRMGGAVRAQATAPQLAARVSAPAEHDTVVAQHERVRPTCGNILCRVTDGHFLREGGPHHRRVRYTEPSILVGAPRQHFATPEKGEGVLGARLELNDVCSD
eukprot:Hpha_TRINITY_DN16083_c5_g1::TRINITY_DN16083_c5_g1_i1::g.117828::m.117828